MKYFGYGLTFTDSKHTFDDLDYVKNTLDDFNLILTELYIPEPVPKVQKIDIPFTSGSIDVTDVTGTTPYNDREGLQFKFYLQDGNPEEWAKIIRRLSMYLHGHKMKMITEFDPSVYYLTRLEVDPTKSNKKDSTVVLKGSADPFKYDLVASNEPWKWNPFSFVDGIIQDTSDLVINGPRTITIIAGGVDISPTFYVYSSTGLTVEYDGKKYSLDKTSTKTYETYRFPQLKIGSNNADLTFDGVGRVSVEYRGRYL